MNFTWYLFSFEGRLSRKPYWLFTGSMILLGLLLALMFGNAEGAEKLFLVLSVLSFWPSLAVQAKRWHDRDKSAWWILINFIPIAGPIWALVENGFLSGSEGGNRFGVEPNIVPGGDHHASDR